MEISALLLAAGAYVVGGFPFAVWLGKTFSGIDPHLQGTGNPGAANVYRLCGPTIGLSTLALDILKGFLPTLLALRLYPDSPWSAPVVGACAVAGHFWMIFLGFKGGKGIATTAGVFLAAQPAAMIPIMLFFTSAVGLTDHISAGSMFGAAVLPLCLFAVGASLPWQIIGAALTVVILIKHIPNFLRLTGLAPMEGRP